MLSCAGVYRIRVLGNNCNLNCFKSKGTTVNRTLGLVFFPQKCPPHMITVCSLEEEKAMFPVSLCQVVCLSPCLTGKGPVALKSDLGRYIKYIKPLKKHPRAIHSASSHEWKKIHHLSTGICCNGSNILLCVLHSITNFASSVFSIYIGYRLQMQFCTFPTNHRDRNLLQ